MRAFLLIAVFLVGCACPTLRVGVAQEKMTPMRPVPLGGYGARNGQPMTGVHDDVWVRAMYFECQGRRLLWMSADLCLIVGDLRSAVIKALSLKPEEVLICATHTHSGPGPYLNHVFGLMAMGKYDAEFASWLQERFVAAGRAAIADASPACVGFGTGQALLSKNRRHEQITDPTVRVLRVTHRDGTPRATLVQFTAHPTVLGSRNMSVSADFPGALGRHLEGVTMFVNGAEGDQGPNPPSGQDDWEQAEAMGAELANVVRSIKTPPRSTLRIRSVVEDVPIKATMPLLPDRMPLQVVRMDETLLLAVPGEMTLALGRRVVEDLREPNAWFVGLANDHRSYFVTPEQYQAGGYERDMCFYGRNIGRVFIEHYQRLADLVK